MAASSTINPSLGRMATTELSEDALINTSFNTLVKRLSSGPNRRCSWIFMPHVTPHSYLPTSLNYFPTLYQEVLAFRLIECRLPLSNILLNQPRTLLELLPAE